MSTSTEIDRVIKGFYCNSITMYYYCFHLFFQFAFDFSYWWVHFYHILLVNSASAAWSTASFLEIFLTRPFWKMPSGRWFNIKMPSYQYKKSHCGDKTVVTTLVQIMAWRHSGDKPLSEPMGSRSSYLHNRISYTGKMVSLYWIRALVEKWWHRITGTQRNPEENMSNFIISSAPADGLALLIVTFSQESFLPLVDITHLLYGAQQVKKLADHRENTLTWLPWPCFHAPLHNFPSILVPSCIDEPGGNNKCIFWQLC